MTLFSIEYDEDTHSINFKENGAILQKENWDADRYSVTLLEALATATGLKIKNRYETPKDRIEVLDCVYKISKNTILV